MAFTDYLNVEVPDYYTVYLTKSANYDIPMPGSYKQVVNDTDGGSGKIVTLKTTPDSTVNLRWTGVSQADADTLSDLYYNPAKAYGMVNSYVWQHPQTLEYFTIQNISEYTQTATIMSYGRYDISFTAKILGVPGLTVVSSGSTLDFEYARTASFTTKYSDGTESLLANPPLKDFVTSATRRTIIIVDDPLLVTQILLNGNSINSLSQIKSYTELTYLYLYSTLITVAPDVSTNTALTHLNLSDTLITVAPDVITNTALTALYLHDCNITEASLSSCVDDLYTNRVALGGNSCVIGLEDNNGLTSDAIAKIEGTGAYAADGIKDAGCTVTY